MQAGMPATGGSPSAVHPEIRLQGISLLYEADGSTVLALDDLNCRFAAGKVTAIIGPSGCGKSTMLQITRGFMQASRGTLSFIGPDGLPMPRPARMATVWQSFNLFPWRTVEDNVAFGLEMAGMPAIERRARAREALRLVDLAGFERKYPGQLSGGMRQRVGMARALVMDPDVLLLDEPFGALDAQTRLVLQEQLAAMVERTGKTVLLITHSIEEAVLLADTVYVLTARPGRVAAEVRIDLPKPRSVASTHDPRYAGYFEQIYGLLKSEVLRSMHGEAEAE
ncbi:MAG: ABC transporter ATP-binding protein [Proteobacteria bacterium]|nr:ABC transporter ATP-binding protein [Pseudomonadota bacterium]